MRIEDGLGKNGAAGVTKSGRLQSESVSFLPEEMQALAEQAFVASTGVITLTGVTKSGVLYLKNEDQTKNLLLSELVICLGKSTGGAGDQIVQMYYAPTGGTLISGALAASVGSLNVASTRVPRILAYKGAYAATIVGGLVKRTAVFQDAMVQHLPTHNVIPAGGLLAVSVTANTSTSSMRVVISAIFSMLDVER